MKYFVLTLTVLAFASCGFNPNELAAEYCECRAEIEKGKKTEADCQSLAESHVNRLQDDPDAMNRYSSRVIECLGYPEIKTKE